MLEEMVDYLIIRHGETALNLEKKHQSRIDSPLTSKGEDEVNLIGKMLKNAEQSGKIKKISKIYASNLGRVVQTVEILSKYLPDVPIEYTDVLREHDMGAYDGLTREEVEDINPGFTARRERDKWSVRAPKGENYQDVLKRVSPFLSRVKREHSGKETVAIVAHRAINRIIIGSLLNYSKEETEKIKQPTDCVYLIGGNKLIKM